MPISDAVVKARQEVAKLPDEDLMVLLQVNAPHTATHIAAQQELAARKEKKEDARHIRALGVAEGANHIAKWAIVIAVLALIVAVVQTFWR